jgi:TolB-like protein/Tfp pilus assembly protein PilF
MSYAFGDYVLDIQLHALTWAGQALRLRPKAFDLLAYLVLHHRRVVPKQELFDQVWPEQFISDAMLNSTLRAIRQAVRESGSTQEIIQTVHGYGYRCALAVTEIPDRPKPPEVEASPLPTSAQPLVLIQEVSTSLTRDRTSVAVLPFRNSSGDREQDYFVAGLAEDIISALSRFRWLLVIAHRTTLVYAAEDRVDANAIGRQLDVRYIVDGSVRKSTAHLRVTIALFKVESAEVIWTEQYHAPLDDLFTIQDTITTTIVGHLDPKLRLAEIARTLRKPTERLDAHDCVMRAVFLLNTLSHVAFLEARAMLRNAIELDPNYASAYAWLAFCHMAFFGQGWAADAATTIADADRCVRAALERDPDDDLALTIAGHFASFVQHDFDRALRLFDRALQINANSAFIWAWSAATYCYLGEPEEALRRLQHYRQLGPLACYAFLGENVYAIAYTIAGRYEEAIVWGRKVVHDHPNFSNGYKPLLASLGHAGYEEEARVYLHQLLQLEPNFSIRAFQERYPFRKATDREHYIAGLRKAGVPETASIPGENVLPLRRQMS